MAEYHLETLQNGIRVAHLPYQSNVAYCGIVINCGSSSETEHEQGIVHFIEHMLFKGTAKRKNYQILNRLENIGGEINAYTTKEETFIYAAFPKAFLARATELMADITFNSTFPENEIYKEKDVVLDEINSYKDSPYESIHDDFEDLIFKDHPLGHNILGTEETLEKFNSDDLSRFIRKNYHSNQIVYFVMGDYSFNRVLTTARKYLEIFPENYGEPQRNGHFTYKPTYKTLSQETYQVHYITGNVAPGIHDDNRHSVYLLNNILGGPGLNSRLNLNLREKNGIAYNIESNYTPFTSNGLITIYFGSDKRNLKKSERIIQLELKKLRETPLSVNQLNIAKRQLIGQLAIGTENRENHFLTFGKSILHYNRFDSYQELIERIQSITALQLQETANFVFNKDQLSSLIIL
ncbi:M16 family metallopeptidase [Saccharicrinis sp. FJH54]|uniref:M16 family metallopeptidase n=1 Tax=Saccharicrinis sp. FJH54 TaxID=3344665 RepID=UPI0035D4A946